MSLAVVEENAIRVVEGRPGERMMRVVEDASRVVEACFSNHTELALLYAANLTASFFDLSSGEAGAILQKLRNYGVRMAVVCPPGTVEFSTRFGDVVVEERRKRYFGVFDDRATARKWLETVEGQFSK
jgi:Domain of unknown function (DUF4180)